MIDVLIAGAGPVGSTLAADLFRRGLRVRLIDKAPHAFEGSRAKGVQPRTQEVLEDLGVLTEAHAEGAAYPLMGIHLGPVTVPWRMQRRHKSTPVRSRYVVGADGGASVVRKSAGLQFAGETDQSDRTLIVDATIDGLSRDRWHVWPGSGGKYVGACPLPHSGQFQLMIRLKPDETPEVDELALAERFRAATGLRLHDVTWTSVFRPNIRIVERYRAGRVFVAGDAAHVHTPAGAQGLNTGVQDAYNLGWKLGQVVAGAPDSLLDSYDAERRPIAARVLGRSTELYSGIDQNRLASLKRGDEERQIKLSYHGGPLAPIDGPATKTLKVGDRAPDSPCAGVGVQRLFEVYQGPHFTLLAFGPKAAEALPQLDWPDGGAALHRYEVQPGRGGGDHQPGDADGLVSRNYGITGDMLILIRPDGYVGSIITFDWAQAFADATKAFATKAFATKSGELRI